MKVINKTKNCELATEAKTIVSFFGRLKGLLGRKSLKEGEGLILKPCYQIHTWFMRFPIDALFLDGENRIIAVLKEMRPFGISNMYLKAGSVLELPAGTILRTKTEVGDCLFID